MEDKDVGKIWASVLAGGIFAPEDAEVAKGLIRKLVEERRRQDLIDCKIRNCQSNHIAETLFQFNIDPATWTKE